MGNGSTWKTFVVAGAAAAALVAAALLSPEGCAQKTPAPSAAGVAPLGPGAAAPSAVEIERWLTEEKLDFRAVEAGKRWAISFQGKNTGTITVILVLGKDTANALVRLLEMPEGASAQLYQALLRHNFAMFQIKLGMSERNELYLSYELRTRALDKRQLLEDVRTVAATADQLYPDLIAAVRSGTQPAQRPPPMASVPAAQGPPPGAMMPPSAAVPPPMSPPGTAPARAQAAAAPPPPAQLPPPTPAGKGATVGNPFLSGVKVPPSEPEQPQPR